MAKKPQRPTPTIKGGDGFVSLADRAKEMERQLDTDPLVQQRVEEVGIPGLADEIRKQLRKYQEKK